MKNYLILMRFMENNEEEKQYLLLKGGMDRHGMGDQYLKNMETLSIIQLSTVFEI